MLVMTVGISAKLKIISTKLQVLLELVEFGQSQPSVSSDIDCCEVCDEVTSLFYFKNNFIHHQLTKILDDCQPMLKNAMCHNSAGKDQLEELQSLVDLALLSLDGNILIDRTTTKKGFIFFKFFFQQTLHGRLKKATIYFLDHCMTFVTRHVRK